MNDAFILEKLKYYREKLFEKEREQAIKNMERESHQRLAKLEAELAQRRDELEAQARSLRQRRHNINIEDRATDTQLTALRGELNALRLKAGNDSEQLRKGLQQDLENQQRTFEAEASRIASEKITLANEQQALKQEHEEFQTRSLEGIEEQQRRLREEQENSLEQLTAIREQQAEFRRQFHANHDACAQQEAEMQAQKSALQSRKSALQSESASLERIANQLHQTKETFQEREEELRHALNRYRSEHNAEKAQLTNAIRAVMNEIGNISESHQEVKDLKESLIEIGKQRNDRYKKQIADIEALYEKNFRIMKYNSNMHTDKYINLKDKLISIMKTNPNTVGLIGFDEIIKIMKTNPRDLDEGDDEDDEDDNCSKRLKQLQQELERARLLASKRTDESEDDRREAERRKRIDKLKAELDEDMTPNLDSIRTHLEQALISSGNREKAKAYKLIVNGIKKELPNEHCSGPFSVKIYEYKDEEKIKDSLVNCVLKLTELSNIQFSIDETRTQFHLTSEYIIVTFYVNVNYEFPDMGLEVGVVLQSNNEPVETPKETLTNKEIQIIEAQIEYIDLNDEQTVDDLVSKHIDELRGKIKKSSHLIKNKLKNHIETEIIRAKVDEIEPSTGFNDTVSVGDLVISHIGKLSRKINTHPSLIENKFKNYIATRIRNKALPGAIN